MHHPSPRIFRHIRMGMGILLAVIVLAAVVAVLFSPPAQADCGGVETSIISGDVCAGADKASTDSSKNPVISVLTFVMQVLTGAVGIAAVGALIYAGILYAAAGGDSSQVQKSKTLIKDTVIGIVCYAGMILILNFVIPGGVFGQQGTTGGGTTPTPTTPAPGTPGGGGSGNMKRYNLSVVSWNAMFDNSKNVGSVVEGIMSSYDVVGLQEIHETKQRSNVKNIASSKIGVYVNNSSSKYTPSYPIVYNKSKLTFVSGGSSKLGNSPAGLRPKYVVYARFKIKDTKQEFFFVNTHLLKNVEVGGEVQSKEYPSYVSAYKKMMPKLKSQIKSLKSANIPIIVTGDFAVNYRRDNCKVAWWPCSTMHSLGIKSSYEFTKLSGISSSQNTYGTSTRLIDYVFVSDRDDIEIASNSILSGGANKYQGSDHRAVTAKLVFLYSPEEKADE